MTLLSPRGARLLVVFFAVLLVIPLAPQLAIAQSTPPTRKAPPPPPPPPAEDQQQLLSYWTTETGWRTELQLRNNQVGQVLTVTPVLRAADGTETPLFPVIVQPQEVKTVDVATAIGNSAPQLIGAYGSLALRYRAIGQGALYAVAMVMGVGHSIAFHIDATGEDQTENAGSREGIWWLPNASASDYLVLTNQGQNILQTNLSVFDASGKSSTQTISLPPRAMNRYSIRQIVAAAKLTGSYGGIKISATAHAGSLDTLHVLFDENGGFSAVMKMFDYTPSAQIKERDYAKTGQWTLRAPMLALSNPDPALAFPVGTTLQPQLLIRNTTSKPVDASLTFNWRTDTTTGKSPGSALHLNQNETRRIDVAALQDGKTIPQNAQWASVTLATTGLPDEVVAVAASYDQSLHFGAQTPFSDQLAAHWAGSQWEYDPQHDSIITVGNGGAKPTLAAFTIFYNQGTQRYELDQTLQPGEQMWMDIGKLIREGALDKNGKPLPSDLTSGSYDIRDLTNKGIGTLFEGKVIYDKTYGHVIYGCGSCCGFKRSALWYDPLGIPDLGTSVNGLNCLDTCSQQWEDVSDSAYGNWTTANHVVATVDYYGTHTGQSIGSTTSSTSAQLLAASVRFTCPVQGFGGQGTDNTTPTISVSCTPTNLAMGTTAPPSTTNGSCSTQASPSGGTYTWTASKNTITITGTNTGAIGFTPANPSSSQGDTTITVQYTVNGQSAKATSSQITTHNPTSLTVLSDTTTPNGYTCTNIPCLLNPGNGTCNASQSTCGYTSYLRTRQYSVLDQFTPANQFVNVGISLATVTETVPFSGTCPGQTIQTGSSTNSTFPDSFFLCNTCCLPGGPGCSCQTNPVQTIYVNGIAVRTETINWTCTTVALTP